MLHESITELCSGHCISILPEYVKLLKHVCFRVVSMFMQSNHQC